MGYPLSVEKDIIYGWPPEDEKKYCPLEYKGNHCRARRNQFKCGVFFMTLHGQRERLRWIAALPGTCAFQ